MAQAVRPKGFVVTAGYGECGPGYIPTERPWKENDTNLTDWCWVGSGLRREDEEGDWGGLLKAWPKNRTNRDTERLTDASGWCHQHYNRYAFGDGEDPLSYWSYLSLVKHPFRQKAAGTVSSISFRVQPQRPLAD